MTTRFFNDEWYIPLSQTDCLALAGEYSWEQSCLLYYEQGLCIPFFEQLQKASVSLALAGNHWDQIPSLSKHAIGKLKTRSTYLQFFQDCRINISMNPWSLYHPRLFDGGMMEAFFLLYAGDKSVRVINLPDEFQEGVHFDTFSTLSELLEKTRYYLDRPEERKAIGNNLSKLLQQSYTYKAFCQKLLQGMRQSWEKMSQQA